MAGWKPYPYQATFFADGRDHRYRLMHHANQVGATTMCAHEIAYHWSGEYPDWWIGRRFDEPVLPGRTLLCTPELDIQRMLMIPAIRRTGIECPPGPVVRYEFQVDDKEEPGIVPGRNFDLIWIEQFPSNAEHDALADALSIAGRMMVCGTPVGRGEPAYLGEYRRSPTHTIQGVGIADVPDGYLTSEELEKLRKAFPPTEAAARFNGIFAQD